MGLGNSSVKRHMDELFGVERAEKLRADLETVSPSKREFAIIEKIAEALQEDGGEYVLPFRFRRVSGMRTSHHLIFVSKNIRGYSIMKDIMAKESSGEEQSVPTFEYNPAWRKQGLLFELSRPLDDLEEMLLKKYAGKTLTLKDIFEDHNIGTRYVIKNYKDALKKMEAAGKISANPSAEKRKKNTFANHVKVTFPD